MEVLGACVLIVTFLGCAYLAIWTDSPARRIAVFAAVGVFSGLPLLLATRVTEVEIPIVGSIRAAAKRAENASDAIEALLADARQRVSQLERLVTDAQQEISQLRANQEFSSLLIRAKTGDRPAFQQIKETAEHPGPLQEIASAAVASIIQDVVFGAHFGAKFPWDKAGLDPSKASIDQFRDLYRRESFPPMRTAILGTMWEQGHLSKRAKLGLLADVIRDDTNLDVVNSACHMMNQEAKLDLNFVGASQYLEWWKTHREGSE